MQTPSFRLATLNVHSFRDSDWHLRVKPLIKILQELSLDLLALQEARYDTTPSDTPPKVNENLNYLSERLQLPNIFFGAAMEDFGNAVLSRYPLKTTDKVYLSTPENCEERIMLMVQSEDQFSKDNNVTICVTHLDAKNEQFRLSQIKQFKKPPPNFVGFQLVVGDFNSLTEDDYSPDYLKSKIQKVREKNSLSEPEFLVTEKMKKYGFQDCWSHMNHDIKDEEVSTCRYGTRVDYIWSRGELKHGWQISNCYIFSALKVSDHNGVFIEFSKTYHGNDKQQTTAVSSTN